MRSGDLREALIERLKEGPASAGELARHLRGRGVEVNRHKVRWELTKLQREGLVELVGAGRNAKWRLKGEGPRPQLPSTLREAVVALLELGRWDDLAKLARAYPEELGGVRELIEAIERSYPRSLGVAEAIRSRALVDKALEELSMWASGKGEPSADYARLARYLSAVLSPEERLEAFLKIVGGAVGSCSSPLFESRGILERPDKIDYVMVLVPRDLAGRALKALAERVKECSEEERARAEVLIGRLTELLIHGPRA